MTTPEEPTIRPQEPTIRKAMSDFREAVVHGVPHHVRAATTRTATKLASRLRNVHVPKWEVKVRLERGPRPAKFGNTELRLEHALAAPTPTVSDEDVDAFIAQLEAEFADIELNARMPREASPQSYVGPTAPNVRVERVWRCEPEFVAISYAYGQRFGGRVIGPPKRYLVIGFTATHMDPFGHTTEWLRPGLMWFGPGKANVVNACGSCGAIAQGHFAVELEFDAFADLDKTEYLITLMEMSRKHLQWGMINGRFDEMGFMDASAVSTTRTVTNDQMFASTSMHLVNGRWYETVFAIRPLPKCVSVPVPPNSRGILITAAIPVDDPETVLFSFPDKDGNNTVGSRRASDQQRIRRPARR